MGKTKLSLIIILLFLLASSAWATSHISANTSIDLANTPDNQELTADLLMVFDTPNTQTLSEALKLNTWVKVNKNSLKAPRQQTITWLKTSVHNTSNQALIRWLVLEPWRLNQVDAFFLNPDTSNLAWHTATGLNIPLEDRLIKNGKTIIPIQLNAGETQQLFIKIHSDSLPFLSIKNWEPVAYAQNINQNRIFQAAVFTGILTLLVVLILQFNAGLFITGTWLLIAFIFEAEKDGFFSNYLLSFLEDYSTNLRVTSWVLTEQLFIATSIFLLGLNTRKNWRTFLILTSLPVLAIIVLSFSLDGTSIRKLGVLITGSYAFSWLFMLIPALRIKHTAQIILLFLLFIYWAISTFLLLGYTFNFYYTSAFTAARIYIEVTIVLALIFTYSWQQKKQLKVTKEALRSNELEYLETLEKAVISRTEDLNSALETAKKANTAKMNFLGQITHDLRSPLTAILGYSQLQATNVVTSQEANQIIQERAFYMKDLVDGLVDYARDVTATKNKLHDIYLITFIDNLVNQAHFLANKQGNSFQLIIETELPTIIRCSSTQLQRILLNLLENAAKYTTQGKISLSVALDSNQLDKNEAGEAYLVFKVSDTGQGIAPYQLEKIYTPFYQGSENNIGSGLGLTICFELTEKLGGKFHLESKLGQGTLATCSIPYLAGDEQLVDPLLPAIQDFLPAFDALGQKAWIIEDSLQIRDLLDKQLSEMQFETQLSASAEDFLAAISEETAIKETMPTIIITDYQLPKSSGREVLRAVREKWPSVPVVLLSATQKTNLSAKIKKPEAFDAYLSKPVDLLELRLTLAKLCNLKEISE